MLLENINGSKGSEGAYNGGGQVKHVYILQKYKIGGGIHIQELHQLFDLGPPHPLL